jgi:hypothetical protein
LGKAPAVLERVGRQAPGPHYVARVELGQNETVGVVILCAPIVLEALKDFGRVYSSCRRSRMRVLREAFASAGSSL